ncbi:unnamed protein product [[Candida] boidinii]|nr:unnamed protein product [[Candida] boidinii]
MAVTRNSIKKSVAPKSQVKKNSTVKNGKKSTTTIPKSESEGIQLKDNDLVSPPNASKPPVFEVDDKGLRYWLVKSEPETRIDPRSGNDAKFSFQDFSEVEKEPWDGVRNYEAKNNLLNMKIGDICLFYHSNCKKPGIVGLAKVVSKAKPDMQQFNSKSSYYDPKSTMESPRWWCPDLRVLYAFKRKVTLDELKLVPELEDLYLLKRGRLSVTPVSSNHFYQILKIQNDGKETIENEFDCNVSNISKIPDNFL